MSQLSVLASTYIERNKKYLLKKYDPKHHTGVVILLFNSDSSFYKEYSVTRSKIWRASGLPSDACSYALDHLLGFPRHVIILSWFDPITFGDPFHLYCLPTAMEAAIEDFNMKHIASVQRQRNNSDEDAWGCLYFFVGLFIIGVVIAIGSSS